MSDDFDYDFPSLRKKPCDDSSNDDNQWLVTYADAITLLMAFFILLIGASTIDQQKFEELSESFSQEILKQTPNEQSYKQLASVLDQLQNEHEQAPELDIQTTPIGIKIEIPNAFLYRTGSAKIRTNLMPFWEDFADKLIAFNTLNYRIAVEGHTDDVPIHNKQYESNWELSAHRATTLARVLISNDINPDIIQATAYADTRPKHDIKGVDAQTRKKFRAENRRTVLFIHRPLVDSKIAKEYNLSQQ